MNTITKFPRGIEGEEPKSPTDYTEAVYPSPGAAFDALIDQLESRPPKAIRPVTAPELLRRASDIMEQRAREYDKPEGERSVASVVKALNAIVGREALTEAEGWLFMELLKNVRLFSAKRYHADSALDGIAYAALMAEARARES